MKEKDKKFCFPLLASDSVNSAIDRFQEEKKQAPVFQKFVPLCVHVSGTAGRDQSWLLTSSSHRVQQKQSVASHAPPQKEWDAVVHSQVKPSKGKIDLWTVLIVKKALKKS